MVTYSVTLVADETNLNSSLDEDDVFSISTVSFEHVSPIDVHPIISVLQILTQPLSWQVSPKVRLSDGMYHFELLPGEEITFTVIYRPTLPIQHEMYLAVQYVPVR